MILTHRAVTGYALITIDTFVRVEHRICTVSSSTQGAFGIKGRWTETMKSGYGGGKRLR